MRPKILFGANQACLDLVYEKLEVPAEEFYPCNTIGVIHNNELIMHSVYLPSIQTDQEWFNGRSDCCCKKF